MKKKITLQSIRIAMLIENFIAILFTGGMFLLTTEKVCNSYRARDFLNTVSAFPQNPARTLWVVLFLYALLFLSFILQETYYRDRKPLHWGFFLFDFFDSILLIAVLDFNYNGLIFLVFAGFIYHAKGERGKYIMIALALASFLLTDGSILSFRMQLFSIQDYFAVYNSATQQYLTGIFHLLTSLNIIFFIIYCMMLIQEQKGTIEQINKLNEEIKKTNAELKNANTQLEEYAKITERMGQTRERNRLAREIHDTLGHTLTGLAVGIDAVVATVGAVPQDLTKKQLENLSDVARNGLVDIRRSVNELKPDSLDRLSLEQAIMKMITDMRSITDMQIFFTCKISNLHFDEDEESAIYRVIQEGITNAMRHGKATKVTVTMEKIVDKVHLSIEDNGVGCNTMKEGFGTKHMQERIGMLNGTVSFTSKEGSGFTVLAKIPIRWGEEYD